jgi:2-C-methyl-D-erythritol 4-phosphate cytidylyltransferase/2-C-methyl-D-erythritol 2,4-cyclodiphosphate synthase
LAKILNIPKFKINIKATTAEKLGFIGRKEGVAVESIATLKFYDWTNK